MIGLQSVFNMDDGADVGPLNLAMMPLSHVSGGEVFFLTIDTSERILIEQQFDSDWHLSSLDADISLPARSRGTTGIFNLLLYKRRL